MGNSEVQPQLSRLPTEPKTLLSNDSEELNKVLVLTIARAIHITGNFLLLPLKQVLASHDVYNVKSEIFYKAQSVCHLLSQTTASVIHQKILCIGTMIIEYFR